MRRFGFLLVAMLVASPALAYPAIGTIVSSGSSTNNATTATPFVVPPGAQLFAQCNGAAYVNVFTSLAGAVATATNAVQINAGQFFPLPGSSASLWTAILPVSGSVTCVYFVDVP